MRQRRRDLHQSRQTQQAVEHAVGSHEDAVHIGVFGHPFELGDAADVAGIRADDIHGALLNQILKIVPQVDLLTRVDRRRGALRDLAVVIR